MLPVRPHWHDAFKRNPHREARLLWFASGPNDPNHGQSPRLSDMTLEDLKGVLGALLGKFEQHKTQGDKQTREIRRLLHAIESRIAGKVTAGEMDPRDMLSDDEWAFIDELLQREDLFDSDEEKKQLENYHMHYGPNRIRDDIQTVRGKINDVLNAKIEAMLSDCTENYGKDLAYENVEKAVNAYENKSTKQEQAIIQANRNRFIEAAKEGRMDALKEKLRAFFITHSPRDSAEIDLGIFIASEGLESDDQHIIRETHKDFLNIANEERKHRQKEIDGMLALCEEEGKNATYDTIDDVLAGYLRGKTPREIEIYRACYNDFVEAATKGKKQYLNSLFDKYIEENALESPEKVVSDFIARLRPSEQRIIEEQRKQLEDTVAAKIKTMSKEHQRESLNPRKVADGFDAIVGNFDTIRTYRQEKRLSKWMKQNLSDSDLEEAQEALHLIEVQHGVASELKDASHQLAEWKEGALEPSAFRNALESCFAKHPRIENILSSFDAEIQKEDIAARVAQWDLLNESSRLEVIEGIWDAIDGNELLHEQQTYLKAWEKNVEKVQELLKPEESPQNKQDRPPLSLLERMRDIRRNGIAGIGFYSPLEWYEATKKIYQAFKDARQDDLDLMSNKLAGSIAGALPNLYVPYGEAVNRRFGSAAEADFNKKKNEYKEELGDDSFDVLVDKFHSVRNDPPRAIAVLEVAASHGWLYEIAELSDRQWPVYIFGVDYATVTPSHWDEAQIKNYFGTLHRQNIDGGNTQRKNGHDRIITQTDPKAYIRRIDELLAGQDYWQAMGIGEALIERAKMPEASEFLAAKFLDHLRKDDKAKLYMNKAVLEQLSMMKWNQALTFPQNMIIMQMSDIQKLYADPNAMNGPLLETIDKLEREITALDPSVKGVELTKKVAQVMSGQTIDIKGKTLSIYREAYRQYWDEDKNSVFGYYKGDDFAKKLGADYFNDAGLLQLPTTAVESIYNTGSTGQLTNQEIAQNFAGFAIKRYFDLKNSNPEDAEIFRQYMANKFDKAFQKALTDRATSELHKYKWKQANAEGQELIASLIYWGFLSEEKIKSYVKGRPKADTFMETIKEQLQNIAANPIAKMEEKKGPQLPPQLSA